MTNTAGNWGAIVNHGFQIAGKMSKSEPGQIITNTMDGTRLPTQAIKPSLGYCPRKFRAGECARPRWRRLQRARKYRHFPLHKTGMVIPSRPHETFSDPQGLTWIPNSAGRGHPRNYPNWLDGLQLESSKDEEIACGGLRGGCRT